MKQPRMDIKAFDQATTQHLLRAGMSGARRPIDELIERLERPDGKAWLSRALHAAAPQGVEDLESVLLSDDALLDQLREIKEHCKSMNARADDPESRLAGLAGYFLSIAAALAQHGELLTKQKPGDVCDALLDLATVMPEQFSETLAQAANRTAS